MFNLKVVIQEFLSLADLFGAQILHIHELAEVVVVGEYKNLILAAFQIVSLGLKNLNNC